MREHGRVYDKKYKIYRFDIYAHMIKSKDEQKMNVLRWKYAGEYGEFKQQLIDKFCSKDFKTLAEDHFIKKTPYKKEWIFGPFDIGQDMLEEEIGLICEEHWYYKYYKVPIDNKELISFFDQQTFSFNVKIVQTI